MKHIAYISFIIITLFITFYKWIVDVFIQGMNPLNAIESNLELFIICFLFVASTFLNEIFNDKNMKKHDFLLNKYNDNDKKNITKNNIKKEEYYNKIIKQLEIRNEDYRKIIDELKKEKNNLQNELSAIDIFLKKNTLPQVGKNFIGRIGNNAELMNMVFSIKLLIKNIKDSKTKRSDFEMTQCFLISEYTFKVIYSGFIDENEIEDIINHIAGEINQNTNYVNVVNHGLTTFYDSSVHDLNANEAEGVKVKVFGFEIKNKANHTTLIKAPVKLA